jgi:RNA polymerase sigma factor (sigma-70 family)
MKSALIKTSNSLELSHHDIALIEDLLDSGMPYILSEKFSDKSFCQELLSYEVRDVDSSWVINHLNSIDGITTDKTTERFQFKKKEEQTIFLKYNYLKKVIDAMSRLNLPDTYGKMVELHHEVQAIKETIATVNMAIVINLANSNTFRNIDFADSVSEGSAAMNVAIDKFSVDAGTKFLTYVYKSINSALIKANAKGAKQSFASVEYDSDIHQGSDSGDPVMPLILDKISEILNGEKEILSADEQFVIQKRYIDGLTLDEIGLLFTPAKPRNIVFYIDKCAKARIREFID